MVDHGHESAFAMQIGDLQSFVFTYALKIVTLRMCEWEYALRINTKPTKSLLHTMTGQDK